MRRTVIYLFGPIDSCPDPIQGWRPVASEALSKYATVFDPAGAAITNRPGQEVIELDEFMLEHSNVLLGVFEPGSVGTCREIERAVMLDKPVFAVQIQKSASPYYNDERILVFPDMNNAISAVIKHLLHGSDVEESG